MELKITNLESNTEEHNYTVVNEIECEMFTYRNEEDLGRKVQTVQQQMKVFSIEFVYKLSLSYNLTVYLSSPSNQKDFKCFRVANDNNMISCMSTCDLSPAVNS